MSLIEALLLLLVLSRVLGELAGRLGQPVMVGEILAGVLLGPSLLNYVQYTTEIKAIASLGVLLLVFIAGMEMDMVALGRAFQGRGAWVSIAGFVVPLCFGMLVGAALRLDQTRIVFIGLCVAITALPISVRILMDLGKLGTDVGQKIVAAAVANDVLALLALGIILDVKAGGTHISIFTAMGWALGKALLFMTVIFAAARLARRYSIRRLMRSRPPFEGFLSKFKGQETLFAVVLLFVIAFASFSEFLGLEFVVGAFFGSMLLSHELLGKSNFEEIRKTAANVTMGFLGPIFFAAIGLQFDAFSLRNWKLVFAILVASFAGKILGGYVGGRLARLRSNESWALGMGLNGRGIMELVIANIALTKGFIGRGLFTTLVLMALLTTIATPVLLKWAYARLDAASGLNKQNAVA